MNVLVNMFFGVLFNAARGISMQVYGVVSQFSYSIGQAITPQITKEYAVGNLPRAISLTFILAKVQGILIMTLSLPLLLETNYVLGLWLGEFPDYTVAFYAMGTDTLLYSNLGRYSWYTLFGNG